LRVNQTANISEDCIKSNKLFSRNYDIRKTTIEVKQDQEIRSDRYLKREKEEQIVCRRYLMSEKKDNIRSKARSRDKIASKSDSKYIGSGKERSVNMIEQIVCRRYLMTEKKALQNSKIKETAKKIYWILA
jgi:hypothetical protein